MLHGGDRGPMSRLTDLMPFAGRRARGAEELSDEAMVAMLRAAAEELTGLRALVKRIALIARDTGSAAPGGAELKLRAISGLLKDHGH